MVEHLTADQEVPSSNLGAPFFFIMFCTIVLLVFVGAYVCHGEGDCE